MEITATKEKSALVIRHVPFEDLGTWGPRLADRGYRAELVDAASGRLTTLASQSWDLVVVLGGPLSVNDRDLFPFLAEECRLLEDRLAAGRPTLGVCLGAQMIAQVLGARVYPGRQKEIGWSSLMLSAAGQAHPIRHLGSQPVLHWHGETFDLPAGAQLLASTSVCENQAFALGHHGLALQFHPEVTAAGLEHWYVGHIIELGAAGLSVRELRAQAHQHAATLSHRAGALLDDWLAALPGG